MGIMITCYGGIIIPCIMHKNVGAHYTRQNTFPSVTLESLSRPPPEGKGKAGGMTEASWDHRHFPSSQSTMESRAKDLVPDHCRENEQFFKQHRV